MKGKKYLNYRLVFALAIIVILATALHFLLGFGLFSSSSDDFIGYLVGSSGFLMFLLIYAILKKID
jgi:hypothetical protein